MSVCVVRATAVFMHTSVHVDFSNQVHGTCMVCFSCENWVDNTWMIVK